MVTTVTRKLVRFVAAIAAAIVVPGCLKDRSTSTSALPAPTNLSGTASSDGTAITLSWTDNSSAETGFRIDVAQGPISSDSDVTNYAMVGANVTTYDYPSLPNTTRFFRVLAITANQQSQPSNGVSVTTPNVPLAPSGVDALVGPGGTDRNVVLYWNDLANESGYQIERSMNGGPWQSFTNPGSNVTTVTDTSTVYASDYRYRIRGFNSNGNGGWSSIARAQTRDISWRHVSSASSGDISWHTSVAGQIVPPQLRSGGVALIAYDATNGGLVWGTLGSNSITTSPISPGFPSVLGYSGASLAIGVRDIPHVVANDSMGDTLYHLTPIGTGWTPTPLANTTDSDRAILKLGGTEIPHVVFQSTSGSATRLRHAWREGTSWRFEDVSGDTAPDYFALAVDGDDRLHVTYRRPLGVGAFELVYATKPSGGTWSTTVVPTTGNVEFNSIALGQAGAIHIVYNELTTAGLHHVTNAGGSWVGEVIHQSPRGSWGRFNSTVVNGGTGEIHVAYYDSVSGNLRYASKKPGAPWFYSLVDGIGDVGRYCAIALSSTGFTSSAPIISYGDASSRQLKLASGAMSLPTGLLASPASPTRIDLTWVGVSNATSYRIYRSSDGQATSTVIATVPAGTTSYADTGLSSSQEYCYWVVAVNSLGESVPSSVACATPAHIATVNFGGSSDFGRYNDIAVDPTGVLHVVHFDQINENALYTTGPVGGPFTTITADSGPQAASPVGWGANGIGVSGADILVASQLAASGPGHGLRLTTITGSTPSSVTLETSTSGSSLGYYPKLRIAPVGTVHVLHLEGVIGGWHWRHAFRVGATWSFAGRITPLEIVAPQYMNNLAIDSNNHLHLAYARYPSTTSPAELVYGSNQGGTWSFVPLGAFSAGDPSLALDAANKAHVAFIQNGSEVVYCTNATGAWSFGSVQSGIPAVANRNPAIAVSPVAGRVHVVYSNNGLRYARKDPGGNWSLRSLDSSTSAVSDISMVLQTGGMMHVAYWDGNAKRLKILSTQP